MTNVIGKITLYATSEKGYKNLTKLSSISYLKDKNSNEPYCVLEDFQKNNEDLILVTGNYNNFFGKLFYSNKLKLFEKIIDKLKYFHRSFIY